MYQWDDQLKMLVDEMGLPVSKSEAREWQQCIQLHLEHAPSFLFYSYLGEIAKRFPSMIGKTTKTEEDFK
jgi:hypothetical protein